MSGTYYNEIDPYAAAWLRNLIAAGLIPAGDVDERSIVDVAGDDLRGYAQCHFFAGIGVAGPTPSGSQDGPTTGPSGLEAAPASRSARPVEAMVQPTNGTYGPRGSLSSASADLASSLANRLARRFALVGSMEYSQTWSAKATPQGRRYWEHTASARPTSASGSTGWPTPNAMEGGQTSRSGKRKGELLLGGLVREMAGWPTPDAAAMNVGADPAKHLARVERLKAKGINGNGAGLPLGIAAQLAGWPTPTTMDHVEREGLRPSRVATGRTGGYITEVLAGWATPRARDWKDTGELPPTGINPDGSVRNRLDQLPRQVANWLPLSGWKTPTANEDAAGQPGSKMQQMLGHEVKLAGLMPGETPSSSPAETGKRGALNPAFPRWLMGFPPEWDACAPTAMRSSHRSPRSS